MNGAADGKAVAENIIKQIYRLSETDCGKPRRADGVADKNAVRNASHRKPDAADQRRNEKAAERIPDKILLPFCLLL